MPKPRKALVSHEATPYYPGVSRCAGNVILCGSDINSGKDYEHRRGWIRQRMLDLVDAFSIDLFAYAVMPNHYHVVLHIDQYQAPSWSDAEVITSRPLPTDAVTELLRNKCFEELTQHLVGDELSNNLDSVRNSITKIYTQSCLNCLSNN